MQDFLNSLLMKATGMMATYYCVRHILKDLLWNTCIMENVHKIFSQKICVLMCIVDMWGTRFDMNEEFGFYTVVFFFVAKFNSQQKDDAYHLASI